MAKVDFVLCTSPDYLARHDAPLAPADLAMHNCIRQGYPQAAATWRFNGPDGVEKTEIDGNAIASGSEAVRELLLAGLGCGILPDFMIAADIRAGRLLPLLPAYVPLARFANLYALYLPSRQGNPKLRAFIDWLLGRLGGGLRRAG